VVIVRTAPRTIASAGGALGEAAFATAVDLSETIPVLQVTVNGRGPLRIGLDTGAMGGLYLFGGRAEQVGLRARGEIDATDPSGRNPQHLATYGEAALDLGGRIFPTEVAGAPTPAPGRLRDLDGIVGLEAFGPALVTIDFARGRLLIAPPGLPASDGRTVFGYDGPLPSLPLEVEAHSLEAYLDTGDVRAGIVLPSLIADQLAGRGMAQPAGLAHTISANAPMYRVSLAGPVRIGDVALASTEAQFPSVAPIGILGAPALSGLVVRIDTLNHRVQVLAPEPPG
jgi:hypothetical protein